VSAGSIVTWTRGRWAGSGPRVARRVWGRVGGFGGCNGLLDILKGQMQLLRIELLRTAAEVRALQLAQQMPQTIILRQHVVALRDRGIPLRARRRKLRLQRSDIRWQLRCGLAHEKYGIRFARHCGTHLHS
jgi:hypothetical protein